MPKVFDDDLAAAVGFGAVVLADREGIHDAGVHQEPKNVAVAFPGLGTHPVVTPELIAPVHTPHEFIVFNNIGGACDDFSGAILLLPADFCGTGGLAVGGHHRHDLLILPDVGHQIALLAKDGLPSLQGMFYEIQVHTYMHMGYGYLIW